MDPNAALRRWRKAIMDRDNAEARDALNDLRSWIRKGGAAPTLKMMPHERTAIGLGKRKNPRRIGESDTAYAHRLEAEMRDVKKKMTSIAGRMKKIAKPRKNPENPRRHFPKTKRGRPPVGRRWTLCAYSASGKVLKRAKASTDREDAFKQARGMVGKTLKGSRIAKVILDGPK